MKRLLIASAAVIVLAGCASSPHDYALYIEGQKAIAQSKAAVDAARYRALAEIAKTGDATASVAAAMAIAMGPGNSSQQQQIAAPVSGSETALRWASILVPSLTQAYGIQQNARVAINQSNNATEVATVQSNNQAQVQINTNSTMLGIAELIVVPKPVVVTQPPPLVVNPVIVQP